MNYAIRNTGELPDGTALLRKKVKLNFNIRPGKDRLCSSVD
jgi:hypothetical protein